MSELVTFADINRYIGLGQRVSVLGRLGRKEMKKYLILPVIILTVSCSDKHIVKVDYGALAEKKVQLEREELDEVFLPSDIYAAGQVTRQDRMFSLSTGTGTVMSFTGTGIPVTPAHTLTMAGRARNSYLSTGVRATILTVPCSCIRIIQNVPNSP